MSVVNDLTDTCKTILKEKCQEIDKVYEYCKQADLETYLKCSETLYNLGILLSGDENHPRDNQQSYYVARYLANNKVLTSRLVQIVAETEDLQLCSYALEIICTVLTCSEAHFEEEGKVFKRNLNASAHFSQLLESTYALNLKFYKTNCEEILLELQGKLLHILRSVYETKRCRDVYLTASSKVVCFLGSLLSTASNKHTKVVCNLLPVLNIMCHKKKNCELLASTKFFDALSSAFGQTKKILTITSILKTMSRNETVLYSMASNANVFKVLFDLLDYSGKKHVNKRTAITILYRITKTECGLEILKNNENYQRLLEWIMKSLRMNDSQNRLNIIKAYTILNRTVTKTVLNPKPVIDTTTGMNSNGAGSSSEESDGENDSDVDSDGLHESDNEIRAGIHQPFVAKALGYLPEMQLYFDEIFNSNNTFKLEMFENVSEAKAAWKKIIEQRVSKNSLYNKCSYPDSQFLEEFDDDCSCSGTNEFNSELLERKFKRAKGIEPSKFDPKIVYDFHNNCSKNCANTTLLFDSHFECGNLNTVLQIDELEYELVLSADTGSNKGLQWFYFEVTNIKSNVPYTFNIVNFLKVNSQYNYGMQPLLFSVTDYMTHGTGWKRVGENIAYFGNNYTNYNGTRQYRTLSFSVSLKHNNDRVYFAYHYPYTYTRLMNLLYPISTNISSSVYQRVDKLCNTINSNEVPILTITALVNESKHLKILITDRPIIFITARVHPGESNSSWIAEGMIKFLLSETNEDACRIRQYFIFKIIPMLNVEGVIYGNTRSGIFGNDFNRCWANPKENSCSEIYYAKKLIEYVRKGLKQDVAACIDIHGHSRKKFFFFYGCNPKTSWNQKDWKQNDCLDAIKVLPRMMSKLNPHIRLNFCRYRIEKNRESTARVVMWREFGIQNSYTLECSYCSGNNNQTINTKILSEIGANVIAALGMMHENCSRSICSDL